MHAQLADEEVRKLPRRLCGTKKPLAHLVEHAMYFARLGRLFGNDWVVSSVPGQAFLGKL